MAELINIDRVCAASIFAVATLFAGCASVPMASKDMDAQAKTFVAPANDTSRVYIFRDHGLGSAIKKVVSIDGGPLFKSAVSTYAYKDVVPGKHTISTESEFGDNTLDVTAEPGKLLFVRNYIKMGVFVGGANLEVVSESEGKKAVEECFLAVPLEK